MGQTDLFVRLRRSLGLRDDVDDHAVLMRIEELDLRSDVLVRAYEKLGLDKKDDILEHLDKRGMTIGDGVAVVGACVSVAAVLMMLMYVMTRLA